MNTTCSLDRLQLLLAGDLPVDDEHVLHQHLEECAQCSAALDQMAGGDAWCREAATLLAGDELDGLAGAEEPWSPADFTVEHLEPSDEPGVLGRLGGYDVLEILGQGGMGIVLKGYDRELKRCVALKVLAPHLAPSALARQRFAREAQAAAAVVHPNVLAIHQVQAHGRLPLLVMPLVAGESLAHRLAAKGTLELKEILRIGMQAAAGLAAAHEQGLVHRDVKPANILLEKGIERVMLTDFGLARAGDDVALTRYGIIAGTPQYMSPEQARGEPLDGRSDLFSLGCVLFEMATGVAPFKADTTIATLRRLVEDPPPAMESLVPDLPPWFIAIVSRLLEKDPARRFRSAREVSELLERCLAHLQQPASVPLPADLPKRPASRNRRWIAPALGALVMLSLAAFGLLAFALLNADPPDIAGQWSGDGWGEVVLTKASDTEYLGTYTGVVGNQPGKIELKWSPIERRYHGTWREGEDRFGEISVRLVKDEIRGAWTVDRGARINPATPRLADLAWSRVGGPHGRGESAFAYRVPFEIGATLLKGGDQITIEEVRGTADTIQVGGMYEIRGTYRLASRDKAVLAAYVTEGGTGPDERRLGGTPTQKPQSLTVERGQGRFALILYMWREGKPHVSFYPASGGVPGGIAHVYFGTGDSVLKKGWWDEQKSAGRGSDSSLDPQSLEYAAKRFNAGTAEARRELFDPPIPDLTVEQLREGFRQSAKLYRSRGKDQVADALQKIAEAGRLPEEASGGLIGSGLHGKDENGQTISRQIVPALVLSDDTTPSGRSLVVLRPLELIYRKDGPVSKGYGDLFEPRGEAGANDDETAPVATDATDLIQKTVGDLAGVWRLESQTLNGKKPDGEGTTGTLTFDKRRATFRLKGSGADKRLDHPARHFTVNPALSPAEINLYGDSFLIQGIYKLHGDTLTLALYGRSEIGRPHSFTADDAQPEGQSLVVMTFRRDRDAVDPAPNATDQRPASASTPPKHLESYKTAARGHQAIVAIAPDGERIAIAGGNPTRILQTDGTSRVKGDWQPAVVILDAGTGKSVASLALTTPEEEAALAMAPRVSHVETTALQFSPDGKLVAVGTSIGQVKLFDAQSGKLTRSLDDSQAKRADSETPDQWKSLPRALASVRSLAFSPDGSLLAVCGGSLADVADVFDGTERLGRRRGGAGQVKVFEVKSGTLKHYLAGHSHVEAVAFSHDGTLVASAGQWATNDEDAAGAIVWSHETGRSTRFAVKANGGAHAVAFSPDGNQLAIASRKFDNAKGTSTTTIQLVQPRSGVNLWQRTFPGYANPKTFTPDGQSVLVLCDGKSIQLLSAETGETQHVIEPRAGASAARWTDLAVAAPAGDLAIAGVDDQRTVIAELWTFAAGGTDHQPAADSPSPAAQTPAEEPPANAEAATTFDITGAITSDQKQPLADAEVKLLATYRHVEKLVASARTDLQGRFVLKDIPPEKEDEGQWRYTLVASAPSFASRAVFVPYAQKKSIDFELALPAAAALRGWVVDAEGNPVAGAKVWTPSFREFIPGIHSATTDASGHFVIADLAAWNSAEEEAARSAAGEKGGRGVKYALRVQHPDHGIKLVDYAQVPTTLYVRFDQPMRVSGKVFHRESGLPAKGATVRAGYVAAATSAQGEYQLTIQPLENLWIRAELGKAKSQSIALQGIPGAAVTLADLWLDGPDREAARARDQKGEEVRAAQEAFKQLHALEAEADAADDPAKRRELLRQAAQGYERFYQEWRQQATGHYARFLQARCLERLGDTAAAQAIYRDLLTIKADTQAFRTLKAEVEEHLKAK